MAYVCDEPGSRFTDRSPNVHVALQSTESLARKVRDSGTG